MRRSRRSGVVKLETLAVPQSATLARVEDAQDHDARAIETVLEDVNAAQDIENELPVFLASGNRAT